jgi:hypothetical protein
MGKIADLFKKNLAKAYAEPGMKLNADTMKDFTNYTKDLKEVSEDKKEENTEATGSGSSGAYSGPLFSEFNSKSNSETPSLIRKGKSEKVEAKEATGSGSVGAYSSPAMWAKSTKKKDWGPSRKTQIPGGGFVKVKKKCTKFPYCNQGDINALSISKNESVKEAIKNVSNKLNISEIEIRKILQNEMNKVSKRTK